MLTNRVNELMDKRMKIIRRYLMGTLELIWANIAINDSEIEFERMDQVLGAKRGNIVVKNRRNNVGRQVLSW